MDEFYSSVNSSEEYEYCWEHGDYDDQYCPDCPHYSECSGGEEDE